MADETIPVTPDIARRALARLRRFVPEPVGLLVIGGTALQRARMSARATTKDVDVVAVTTAPDHEIPDAKRIAGWLAEVCDNVRIRKDQTSVSGRMRLDEGPVLIEIVRGRKAGGGYFVSRRVLRAVAAMAADDDGILVPPPEAVAFLKAWAAHDQAKLVGSGRDRHGRHAMRGEVFRSDVRAILEDLLAAGSRPDGTRIVSLLDLAGAARRTAMLRILEDAGWAAVVGEAAGEGGPSDP